MAHQDVVPVTPGTEKDWKYPPFAGTIADNAVWGRGTVDDKGSLVGLFEAIEALAVQGFKPKRSIYLVSGHDEEAGGSGAIAAAAQLKAKGVKAIFTIDEGSIVLTDTPVINGPAILIGVGEKGYGTLKVTANAPGGHSSMPPAETGVETLAKAILDITGDPFPMEVRGPGASMIEVLAAKKGGVTKMAVANQWLFGPILKRQLDGSPSTAAAFHTTIAPTMLEGSPKENVLPQSANALINYRIAPGTGRPTSWRGRRPRWATPRSISPGSSRRANRRASLRRRRRAEMDRRGSARRRARGRAQPDARRRRHRQPQHGGRVRGRLSLHADALHAEGIGNDPRHQRAYGRRQLQTHDRFLCAVDRDVSGIDLRPKPV